MEVVFDQLEVALIGTGLRIEHDDGVAEILAGESVLHHPLRRIAVSAVPLRPRSFTRSCRMAKAISSTCVSSAKCPVSRNWTVAFGLSHR